MVYELFLLVHCLSPSPTGNGGKLRLNCRLLVLVLVVGESEYSEQEQQVPPVLPLRPDIIELFFHPASAEWLSSLANLWLAVW